MDYIMLGLYIIAGLAVVLFLFKKVTPNNVPANLSGHFTSALTKSIILLVVLFVAIWAISKLL